MAGHNNAQKFSSSHYHHRRRIHFPVGTPVEVNTDDEGLENVYFSATVTLPPSNETKPSKKLFVEYKDLLTSEDGSDPLRESVKLAFLRPAPPPEDNSGGFEPGDVVDAFYKDGWWIGSVARPVEGGDRFVVSFDDPPDELEFGLDELRAHWDWTKGKWMRPKSKAGVKFGVGRRVEVSFDREELQDAWFPATVEQNLENREFVVEYRSPNGESMKADVDSLHIRPCPPLFKPNNSFILLGKVCAFFDYGWWDGVITKELENNRCVVFFKQLNRDKEFDQSELRPPMEWKEGEWWLLDDGVHDTPDQNSAATAGSMNGSEALSSRPKRRQYQSDSGSAAMKKHGEGNVGNASPGSANYMKICEALMAGDGSEALSSRPKRRQYESDLGSAAMKKHREGNVGNASPGSANYMKICEALMAGDQSSCISSLRAKKFEMPKRVRSKRVGRNPKRVLLGGDEEKGEQEAAGLEENGDEEKGEQEAAGLEENHSLGKEERNDITKKGAVEIQDCHKGKVMEIDEVPNNESDDEPLANMINDIVSPCLIDGPTNQCLTDGEKQQLLPFAKNIVLWQTVESMEVFQRLPQKPHFKPLEQISESLREGLALGHMVTFANLVERISRLQLYEDTMETLSVLEEHGFDVGVVRECISKVLAAKDKEEKLLEVVNNLKNRILERNLEKNRIEEESREIQEQIKRLQVKLEFAEAAKEKAAEEIGSLQATLEEAEENMKNATRDVEGSVFLF